MLTLDRCRDILGTRCRLSDQELEELRDHVYAFADIALRIAKEKHADGLRWNSERKGWEADHTGVPTARDDPSAGVASVEVTR